MSLPGLFLVLYTLHASHNPKIEVPICMAVTVNLRVLKVAVLNFFTCNGNLRDFKNIRCTVQDEHRQAKELSSERKQAR